MTLGDSCLVDGCDRPIKTAGYCVPHYKRRQVYGDPLAGPPLKARRSDIGRKLRDHAEICVVEGCPTEPTAQDLCYWHYIRMRRGLDPHTLISPATYKDVPEGFKRCKVCDRIRELDKFDVKNGGWRVPTCRECIAEAVYGPGAGGIERRRAADEPCVICGERTERMCIDHCHNKKVVRDLLCNNCNPMIAHAKDDIDILKSAIKYLERFQSPLMP